MVNAKVNGERAVNKKVSKEIVSAKVSRQSAANEKVANAIVARKVATESVATENATVEANAEIQATVKRRAEMIEAFFRRLWFDSLIKHSKEIKYGST